MFIAFDFETIHFIISRGLAITENDGTET